MIRSIRLLGAALGGLIGIGFAAPNSALIESTANGGWIVAVWVLAWIVVGFALLPY